MKCDLSEISLDQYIHSEYTEESWNDFISKLFHRNNKENSMPRELTFQVTDDCTLRCTYCYQHHKGKNRLSFETAKEVIDQLLSNSEKTKEYIDSYETPGIILDFIGGEPLLEVELIDKIIDYFINQAIKLRHPWATRFRVSICSNGTLYFEPKVQEFIKKHKSHLSFTITMDGAKDLHDACRVFPDGSGSYDKAIAAVKHFTEYHHGYIGSKMTISPYNITKIAYATKEMIKNGYSYINLNCVYEEGWNAEYAKILYYQLKELTDYLIDNDMFDKIYLSILCRAPGRKNDSDQNWCGGTGSMLAVDYKGLYYPCQRYMENSVGGRQEPYAIGSIENGIGKEEKYKDRIDLLNSITCKSQSEQKCLDCPISAGCGWCSAYNYEVFGTPNKRATFICQTHQAEVLACNYAFNKYFKSKGMKERLPLNIPEEWALEILPKEEYELIKEGCKEDDNNSGEITST